MPTKIVAKTKSYEPITSHWIRRHRKLPVFSFQQIEQMMLDETIQIGLASRAAPMQSAQFGHEIDGVWQTGVQCGDPTVAAWITRQLETLWGCALEHIATAQIYGWSGMEVIWGLSEVGLSEIKAIEPRHANDVKALVDRETGRISGVQFLRIKQAESGRVELAFPECLFHAYKPPAGKFYGDSVLKGAYRPWFDKNGEGGALDVRRLFMHKDAYGGADLSYPEGTTDIGTPDEPNHVPNRELAREFIEQLEAGGVTTLPSAVDEKTGKPLWVLTRATVAANPGHILQYPDDLDGEMLRGMYVPDGVLKADDSGSWQGRLIPLGVMFANVDPWLASILRAICEQLIKPAMLRNWGRLIRFNVKHKPLAQQALEQQKNENQQTGQAEQRGQPWGQPPGQPREDDEDDEQDQNPLRLSLDPVDAVGRGVLSAAAIVRAARIAMRERKPARLSVDTETKPEPDSKPNESTEQNDQAQVIAEILTGLFGDAAESHFDEIFGSAVQRMSAFNAIDHPRGPDGRFIEKNSPEAVSAAHDAIRQTLKQPRTPATLKKVTENLSILTTKQLRDLKQEYGINAGGVRQSLVAKIASRLHGKSTQTDEEANPLREDRTPKTTANKDVYTVPTKSLKVDPTRFQYKVKGIGADGVTDELKGVGKWNPELAGTLLVWRDPANGKDYVVNGHHRHELASRLGADDINVRYIEAANAKEARSKGALANIAEGRGTAVDAAKYLRDSGNDVEHLRGAGISLAGKVANDATILKNLADKPFQMVTDGRLDEAKALAVAKHLKDPDLQTKLFKKIDDRENDGKDWSNREIETAAKKMANAGTYTQHGQDLFGDFSEEHSTFDQEVELESHAARQLQQEASDYRAVANKRRAERVADAGNVLAVDENARRADAADSAVADFERESRLRSPVSQQTKINAAAYAEAKTKKQREAIKDKNASETRALLNIAKEGDRHPNTGLVWKDNAWTKDAETSITVQESTYKEAKRTYPEKRQAYLKQYGRFDSSGNLEGVVLNTDDWRSQFSQYVGTNAHEVHEAAAFLNNKMYEDGLKELSGKGNKKMLILAGGGGSGKGTATKDHFDLTKYPMVLDQASGNYPKLEKKLDEAIANGFTPEHVFVDRGVSDAMSGVIGRAINALNRGDQPRTVPLAVAMQANIDARKATLELLRKRSDIDTKVVDNTSNAKGKTRLIKDRNEAISYLEGRISAEEEKFAGLHESFQASIAGKLRAGEIPEAVAEGLFDSKFVEDVKNGKHGNT